MEFAHQAEGFHHYRYCRTNAMSTMHGTRLGFRDARAIPTAQMLWLGAKAVHPCTSPLGETWNKVFWVASVVAKGRWNGDIALCNYVFCGQCWKWVLGPLGLCLRNHPCAPVEAKGGIASREGQVVLSQKERWKHVLFVLALCLESVYISTRTL